MVASNTDPIVPSPDEIELARRAAGRFEALAGSGGPVRLAHVNGAPAAAADAIEVPAAAFALFRRVLEEMARGHAVTLVPIHAELTTQQAADLLGVSRPFVIKLIDEGKLPHRLVGTHRRVLVRDLMAWKRHNDEARRRSLDELARLTQELGLDD